jgi:hypothetical protein
VGVGAARRERVRFGGWKQVGFQRVAVGVADGGKRRVLRVGWFMLRGG